MAAYDAAIPEIIIEMRVRAVFAGPRVMVKMQN